MFYADNFLISLCPYFKFCLYFKLHLITYVGVLRVVMSRRLSRQQPPNVRNNSSSASCLSCSSCCSYSSCIRFCSSCFSTTTCAFSIESYDSSTLPYNFSRGTLHSISPVCRFFIGA